MQVAINPRLYNTAQIYAEQQGLNLPKLIEGFLEQFMLSVPKPTKFGQASPIDITPRVARLKTGRSWKVSDEELDRMRYEYLEEKYR
jgi:hypothetical protein